MNKAEANMFVDSVENMHEKQQGLLPDGKLHIQPKAREAFNGGQGQGGLETRP